LLSRVKQALSSGPSSRGSGSRSGDNGSQDSPRSLSFVPSLHGITGSSRYLAQDDVPAATDGNDISIRTTEELEKYESLHRREFAHTRIYDVNILERVGLDEELSTILWTIGWGKLYDDLRLGSRLLTIEFLLTFEIVEKNRKSFVMFHLFGKSFGCDFPHFSKLLDFSKSCLPESRAMRNFNKVEFSDAISGKSTRLRFSDIHNPSLRFLHRWISFMLFPMVELHSVATPELKRLFAMVNRIKYTPIDDIVDYFKNVLKMLGPIECTSMVTQITMNLGCLEMANLAYIEGMYLFLVLTILFMRTSYARNLIILYPCCMVIRQSGYPTRPFDYILVKVLHCSLIEWERCTIASQDHLTLTGKLVWRHHSRPRLHRRLTLKSPNGTLGMGLATSVTMRMVGTIPLMVIPSLASEPEAPSLSGTLTGTLLWSGTPVMGLIRLSVRWKGSNDSSDRWMTLHMCKWRCKLPSTHRLV
jgi:hypothetical protein